MLLTVILCGAPYAHGSNTRVIITAPVENSQHQFASDSPAKDSAILWIACVSGILLVGLGVTLFMRAVLADKIAESVERRARRVTHSEP